MTVTPRALRLVLATLVVATAATPALDSVALAQEPDPGPTELWSEFPLDPETGATEPAASTEESEVAPPPAPAPPATPQSGTAGTTAGGGTGDRPALVATGNDGSLELALPFALVIAALAFATLLFAVGSVPASVVPATRFAFLLAAHRLEILAAGLSVFLGLAIALLVA